MTKLPKEVFVFLADHDQDGPIYGATTDLKHIPDDIKEVGVYTLQSQGKLVITRELK